MYCGCENCDNEYEGPYAKVEEQQNELRTLFVDKIKVALTNDDLDGVKTLTEAYQLVRY